ncbi:Glutathione S-transferase 1 [Aphelenchoides fujianensis]|nr:Glutathione S-transferase 1 [Aphelenchoides fujianensis]
MSNSNYKFTYLTVRGFGEVSRLILHHAGVKFEDVDGHRISQSGAIVRFLARRFGLEGADEFEKTRADEIYAFYYDRMREHREYHLFRLQNPGKDSGGESWVLLL